MYLHTHDIMKYLLQIMLVYCKWHTNQRLPHQFPFVLLAEPSQFGGLILSNKVFNPVPSQRLKKNPSVQQFLHLWSIKNPIPTRLRCLRCLSSWSPTEAFWLAGAGNFSSGQKKCPAPGDKTLDFVKWKNPLGRWPFCFVLPCFRKCLKAAATSMAESLWDASLTRLNPIQNPFAWLVWRRFITLLNGRFSLDWTRKVTFCWLILKNTTFDKLVLFCHDPSSGFWFFLKFLEDGLWRF